MSQWSMSVLCKVSLKVEGFIWMYFKEYYLFAIPEIIRLICLNETKIVLGSVSCNYTIHFENEAIRMSKFGFDLHFGKMPKCQNAKMQDAKISVRLARGGAFIEFPYVT